MLLLQSKHKLYFHTAAQRIMASIRRHKMYSISNAAKCEEKEKKINIFINKTCVEA